MLPIFMVNLPERSDRYHTIRLGGIIRLFCANFAILCIFRKKSAVRELYD